MFHQITACRICGNKELHPVLNLGEQYLTGVFPRTRGQHITRGPLELVKCHAEEKGGSCGLLQLRHSYDLNEMYGENYGYRSSLNRSMVEHLRSKVADLLQLVPLKEGDLAVDIGSNDGTLLSFYPSGGPLLAGIDPSADKFRKFYRSDIQLVTDFFSLDLFRSYFGDRKAKIITSIAMFYDIERPLDFIEQIGQVLDQDGIWHFEQSYLPSMLKSNAYDTVCHEHLEYYGLRQIKWMTDRMGLKILDARVNDINGGSFAVTVAKANSSYQPNDAAIQSLFREEQEMDLESLSTYATFAERVFAHRDQLLSLLRRLREEGKVVLGYGASTKGNVILQFCGLGPQDLPCIAEVNPDKFGCFTPGSDIPIISEREARDRDPDYFLVLPWHFKENLLQRESAYLRSGGKMLFPLPQIEAVPS